MQGKKTAIKTDLHSASELRAMARGDVSPRKVKRLLALANALDGMTRPRAGKRRARLHVPPHVVLDAGERRATSSATAPNFMSQLEMPASKKLEGRLP
jgi:hypothetical protein